VPSVRRARSAAAADVLTRGRVGAAVVADSLRYRLATRDDVPTAAGILEEATRWLHSRGLPTGWPIPYPAGVLFEHVARSELYLVDRGDDGVVATVTLQWEDVRFWGERPPDACYFHHFAVRRSAAGHGVGGEVVRWAERTARSRGRSFLRLDCVADDPKLIRYYETRGFERRGEKLVGGLWVALLEKPFARG
jgi:GNAT superfamily N-acetyltransferase